MDDIKGKIDFYETRKCNLLAIKENTINQNTLIETQIKEYTTMNTQIENIKQSLLSVQQEVESAENDLALNYKSEKSKEKQKLLGDKITEIRNIINLLDRRILTESKRKIEELEEKKAANTTALSSLQSEIDGLQREIMKLSNRISIVKKSSPHCSFSMGAGVSFN